MELQTTTGLRSDGVYVLVDNVERGKACDCVCPACQTPLIARQGQKVRWHFAHESSANITRHCSESDLHLSTKLAIAESKSLKVPAMFNEFDKPKSFIKFAPNYYGWNVFDEATLHFDSVKVESKKDNYIPDLIGYANGIEYLIEVVVSHDIDENKMLWIKDNDINCIRLYPKKNQSDWVWSSLSQLSLDYKLLVKEISEIQSKYDTKHHLYLSAIETIKEYENTSKMQAIVKENEKLTVSLSNKKRNLNALEYMLEESEIKLKDYTAKVESLTSENRQILSELNWLKFSSGHPQSCIQEMSTEIELLKRECIFKDKVISNLKKESDKKASSATPWRTRR